MKKILLFIIAFLFSISANATKLESDIITTPLNNCLVTIGNVVTDVVSPAVTVTGGKICSYDLASIQPGPYVSSMKAQVVDPMWGSVDSVASAPFSFTKPSLIIPAITGLHLTP